MKKAFNIVLAISMIVSFAAAPAAVSAQTRGPTEQVRIAVDQIINLLQDKTLAPAERNARITELVKSKFDFQAMSQAVLGPHWRTATPAQRTKFVDLFSNLLETTYRERLEAHSGEYTDEQVQYLKETIKGDRAQVDTVAITKTARIPINYRMILRGNEWLVYDVVIEEVSLIRTYRSSYDDIVRKEGFDGLFARMESKVEELRRTGGGGSSP